MYRLVKTLNRQALVNATVSIFVVIAIVIAGSRNLQNFDAALVAYLFGTVFAVFGIAYRYSVWLQRPPTRLYWYRSWQFLFSKNFIPYALRSLKLFLRNILLQRFYLSQREAQVVWSPHACCWLCFSICNYDSSHFRMDSFHTRSEFNLNL